MSESGRKTSAEGGGPISARIVKVDAERPDRRIIEEAAKILRSGGLVAFPTETVYGIGASCERQEAIQRLYRLKERPAGKPFTTQIADVTELGKMRVILSENIQVLVTAFWPGPLTLVLKTKDGSKQGVRCPANEVARELIRASGVRVAVPSANISGQTPPVDAQDVMECVGAGVDLILDGGRCRLGVESTVLDVSVAPFKVLREGAVDMRQLRSALDCFDFRTGVIGDVKSVLIVCTGNSCRSPMAEGLMKKMLGDRKDIIVSSAGISAPEGLGPTGTATSIMRKDGIDISSHRARGLTEELLKDSDLILVMERHQARVVTVMLPDAKGKTFLISRDEVPDPIACSFEGYETCYAKIKEGIKEWVKAVQ